MQEVLVVCWWCCWSNNPNMMKNKAGVTAANDSMETCGRRTQSVALFLVLMLIFAVTVQEQSGLRFQGKVESKKAERMDQQPPPSNHVATESENDNIGEDEEEDSLDGADQTLPCWPCRVWDVYKQMHSQQALLEEQQQRQQQGITTLTDRKFAVVYYWCPNRAGNLLHNFFNSMAWAVITNRTLLWAYENNNNELDECQQVLERADWLPSWSEWSEKLHLPEPTSLIMDESRWKYDAQLQTVYFPQISDVLSKTKLVRNDWRHHPLHERNFMMYIQAMEHEVRERAGMLYYNDVDFLFGMFFRDLFTIQGADEAHAESGDFSVALHSRHTVAGDDGSFISDEVECLNKILPHKRTLESCRVYLMSDRPATMDALSDWLLEHNCSAVTASHESGASLAVEHGPWAGAGFLQDIALASQARDATIGDTQRSSFMLLKELVTYDRIMGGAEPKPEMPHCQLPPRNPSGYDYGPGTPTFRNRDFLDPLEPIGVLQRYQKSHSAQSESSDERYLVATDPCRADWQETLHIAANNLLVAILSDRTLVWAGITCHNQSLASWVTVWEEAPPDAPSVTLGNITNYDDVVVVLHGEDLINPLEHTSWKGTLADMGGLLWSVSSPFLYGLLMNALFELDSNPVVPRPSTTLSVALVVSEAGALDHSQNCLMKLLETANSTEPCVIHVTVGTGIGSSSVEALAGFLSQQGADCILAFPESDSSIASGAWAAALARSAFVGDARSVWVRELIEYERRVEIWRLGRLPPLIPDFHVCLIDDETV